MGRHLGLRSGAREETEPTLSKEASRWTACWPQLPLIALLGAEEAHTSDFEFGHRPARQALVDSDRANGSQEVSDSLSMAEGLTATGKRVANKLGSGALLGSLSGGILAYLARGGSGGDALGVAGAYAAVYNWWVGYTIGAAVGVTAVDPRDHFMASIGWRCSGRSGGHGTRRCTIRGEICSMAFVHLSSRWRDDWVGTGAPIL